MKSNLIWCDSQFRAFNEKIRLDITRRQRIESAISAFSKFCETDGELAAAKSGTPFLQGSVATDTVIRPLSGDEFDVDLVYPFRLSAFGNQAPQPKQIVDWFTARLKLNDFYKERLIPKPRCVRINYAGDFHFDIIPAAVDLADHKPFSVPTRDTMNWVTNDPHGFANWVEARDERSGDRDSNNDGRFVRSVRVMKRWRDQFFGEKSAVSSILLVTFLGNHDPSIITYNPPLENPLFPANQHDAAYLYDMLRLTHGCLQNPAPKAFSHPTPPYDNLASNWDSKYLELFLQRLGGCIKHMENAFVANSEAVAIGHYQKAFGETFPSQ